MKVQTRSFSPGLEPPEMLAPYSCGCNLSSLSPSFYAKTFEPGESRVFEQIAAPDEALDALAGAGPSFGYLIN